MKSLGFSTYRIMSYANRENFTSSLLIRMPFFPFCCFIAAASTSSTNLNKSGESGYSCLAPGLRGRTFRLAPVSFLLLAMDLSGVAFMTLNYISSLPTSLWGYFKNHKWMLNIVKSFFFMHLLRSWFLSFILFLCITLIYLYVLNHLFIPGIKPIQLWCAILLMGCWIQLANILLSICVLQKYWPVTFLCPYLVLVSR